MRNVVEELSANAQALSTGELAKSRAAIERESRDVEDGLRLYYPQVATMATRTALLSGALDSAGDRGVAEALGVWAHTAEVCNKRFTMGELLLFSTESSAKGIKERLRIHASIATGAAVRQREALASVVPLMVAIGEKGAPGELSAYLANLAAAVTRFERIDDTAADVQRYADAQV